MPRLLHIGTEVRNADTGALVGRKLAGWGYLYEVESGRLRSEGTIIAEPMPAGCELLEAPARADPRAMRWDAEERQPTPYVDVDRVAELRRVLAELTEELTRLGG